MTDISNLATLSPHSPIVRPNDIVTPAMMDNVQQISDKHGGEPVQVEVVMSASEAAIGELISKLHQLIGTFYDMMGKGKEAGMGRQKNYARDVSHFADNVARLSKAAVAEAMVKCGHAKETEKAPKMAQTMLRELHLALRTVDIERNSAPAIGACRLFYQCAHLVLRNDHTDAQRQSGVDQWREKLWRIMRA